MRDSRGKDVRQTSRYTDLEWQLELRNFAPQFPENYLMRSHWAGVLKIVGACAHRGGMVEGKNNYQLKKQKSKNAKQNKIHSDDLSAAISGFGCLYVQPPTSVCDQSGRAGLWPALLHDLL